MSVALAIAAAWVWFVGLVIYRAATGPHPINWLGAVAWPIVAPCRGYLALVRFVVSEAGPRARRAR